MKVREREREREIERERGIGQYVNEGGEEREGKRQEGKTKKSHVFPVELSLANTSQSMCACLMCDLGNYGLVCVCECLLGVTLQELQGNNTHKKEQKRADYLLNIQI